MPKEYSVDIQNEEASPGDNALSITGAVNGLQCAAKVRLTDLEGLSKAEAKRKKQLALIDGFENRRAAPAPAGAERVTV